MRWKLHLSYDGTAYAGWQRQPHAVSVQQTLEDTLSVLFRQPVVLTGCGRTDAGVHARGYVAHADLEGNWVPDQLRYQANAMLPRDVAIDALVPVHDAFHARYDAISRSYTYYLHFVKDPFRRGRSWYFPRPGMLDVSAMQAAADVLLRYGHFKPFCKTGSDVSHFACRVMSAQWIVGHEDAEFHITANRFLRGMVRLIVGACLNAGLGKLSLDELVAAMEQQTSLPRAWSVPAEGLFLRDIVYPERPGQERDGLRTD